MCLHAVLCGGTPHCHVCNLDLNGTEDVCPGFLLLMIHVTICVLLLHPDLDLFVGKGQLVL